jgi:hypothetical protein
VPLDPEDVPVSGGMVFIHPATNLGTCGRCGWHGVPLPQNRTWCPKCNHPQLYPPGVMQNTSSGAPGRNDPCDCGSGRKAKKCCHR